MITTELCKIMTEEGSDKSGNWHNYTIEYYSLFNNKKDKITEVFELGLGTNYTDVKSSMGPNGIPGASLRGWKRFFNNANIYGADIDKRILFTEDRIKTYYVDQTDISSISQMWQIEELKNNFDVMLDDGLHDLDANMIFFENSFHKLKETGIYIIEDVGLHRIEDYKSKLSKLQNLFKFNYEIKNLNHHINKIDNCLIFITKE